MKTNSKRSLKRLAQKGYSIIEVMLTLVVVGVGILAIVQLQSSLSGQVGNNKAKAEATTIAEARIEELRNYTNQASTFEEFNDILVASSDVTLVGINADFLRHEEIQTNGRVKNVSVTVSWSDRIGDQREITVTSEIAYVPPESSGQNSISYASSIDLSPATGIAKPGDGKVTDLSDNKRIITPTNGDGTYYVIDGDNKYLIDADGNIQLILEGVCQSDGINCTENFTRIHGRVYIDRRSYLLKSEKPVTPGAVNLIASNTAYCARYYLDQSGKPVPVNNGTDTDMTLTGPDEDYKYLDYTCYVSRGWYGNIGVYVYYNPDEYGGTISADSLSRATRTCMGDPKGDSDLDDGSYPQGEEYDDFNLEYALSTYRAYRGMIYKADSGEVDGTSILSVGVAGGLDLGFDNTSKPMHNFVISYVDSSPEIGECLELSGGKAGQLRRPDSDLNGDGIMGDLFENVPDDFVCLNPGKIDYNKASYSNYNDDYCPADPTTPVVAP